MVPPPNEISPAAGSVLARPEADALVAGLLHIYVAFDWGDEINLEHAQRLVPAEVHELPRRRRTPSSIGFRPLPLRFALRPVPLELPELGTVQAGAEATVFDFAAVSVALHVPFRVTMAALLRLAGHLAASAPLVRAARLAVELLHQKLLAAIQDPLWKDDLSEEYFVFQLPPGEPLGPEVLLGPCADWLAGLVRLEAGALSAREVEEAVSQSLSYSPADLFVPDWAAAVLLDRDCDETLQTIEFVNLQLLEYRHIDERLDDRLAAAYRQVYLAGRRRLPFWRSQDRPLRLLGEMKVEANGLFERTINVLKLVGDTYLARVYRLLANRFHLREWERAIQRKLEVAESAYGVIADQTANYRMEFLELVVVFLIVLEVLLSIFRH
jgi:hypothetical protein